jgi:hypothetical protein
VNETQLKETELEKEATIVPTSEMKQARAKRRADQWAKEPPEQTEKHESEPPPAEAKVESTKFDESPPTPPVALASDPVKNAEPAKAAEVIAPAEPGKAIAAPMAQLSGTPAGAASPPEKPAANDVPVETPAQIVRRSTNAGGSAAKPNKRRELAAVFVILALIALGDLTYVEIQAWQKTHSNNSPANPAIQESPAAISSDIAPANPAPAIPPQTTAAATSSQEAPAESPPPAPTPPVAPPTPPPAAAIVASSLIVQSEPRADEVLIKYPEDSHGRAYPNQRANGLEVIAGKEMEISLAVPDYDPVSTNVSPLQPGERKVVDFGKLALQAGSLQLNVEPADAQFTLIYPGRDPIACPPGSTIEGIVPNTTFEVVVERKGYVSASNGFTLQPHEQAFHNFGRLKPLPGSLAVSAPAQPFDLKVAWDGATNDYGTAGTAANLPAGKNLLIAVSVDGFEPALTNVILAPGEVRAVSIAHLEPVKGYLLLKSDPEGAEVSYRIDGQRLFSGGMANRINNLPLGHLISVTLVKNGYVERTMQIKLLHSGDTLDFGKLVARPRKALLIVAGPNDGAEIYVNGRWTGVKNGGTIPNLTVGESYEIRLRKLGRADLTRTVTMKGDGVEQTEYFPEMQAGSSSSDIDEVVRDINASIITVKSEMPLSAGRRRFWSDWIGQVETSYQGNPQIWARIKEPLAQLRALVNTPTP